MAPHAKEAVQTFLLDAAAAAAMRMAPKLVAPALERVPAGEKADEHRANAPTEPGVEGGTNKVAPGHQDGDGAEPILLIWAPLWGTWLPEPEGASFARSSARTLLNSSTVSGPGA